MRERPRSEWQFGVIVVSAEAGTPAAGMLVVYELRSPDHDPVPLVSFMPGEWDPSLAVAIAAHFTQATICPSLKDDPQAIARKGGGRLFLARNREVGDYLLALLQRGELRPTPPAPPIPPTPKVLS